jgi:hypothetical protein
LAVVGNALAKGHRPKGSGAGGQVVAHISFSGPSDVDMAMQKKVDDKYYFYVHTQKTKRLLMSATPLKRKR